MNKFFHLQSKKDKLYQVWKLLSVSKTVKMIIVQKKIKAGQNVLDKTSPAKISNSNEKSKYILNLSEC